MSDFYEDEDIEQQTNVEMEQESPPAKKERYKSTKDQTKRREQAMINLKKGRDTRLANLAKKKNMMIEPVKRRQPVSVQYYDESSSDSEEFILERKSKSKKSKSIPNLKPKRTREDPYNDRMDRLEAMIASSLKHKKPRLEPAVARPKQENPVLQSVKRVLLDL